jgi:hypothetical protein
MNKNTKLEVFGITPDQIRIERGKCIMYLLLHPDERPFGSEWVMQRRSEGCFSLWRRTSKLGAMK